MVSAQIGEVTSNSPIPFSSCSTEFGFFILANRGFGEFPNISFLAGTFLMGSKVWAEGISINYQQQINFSSGEVSGNFVDYRLNSTAINSVYGASDTNQPEAVRVLSLVKAY